MPTVWIKPLLKFTVLALAASAIVSCSSVKKVVREDQPTMEQIYNEYAGGDEKNAFELRKRQLQLRDSMSVPPSAQSNFPPTAKQLAALYPKLPNPDLFMYVRPHAIGMTGAPIPAYMTRFGLYDRDQYALPGESVETIRRNAVVKEAYLAEQREAVLAAEEDQRRKKDRENLQLQQLRAKR
jgi:conjugative transfer region lipoprotein (TIGR03751 family)